MALTDFSDIYAALHDAGINRVIKHLMQQRPALFNYGTENVRRNLGLLCTPITADPGVTSFLTVLDPIPVIGVNNLGLDFCIQLTDLEFDFYPSDTVTLPTELNTLAAQQFALKISVCAGLSCIPKRIRDTIRPGTLLPGALGSLRSMDKQIRSQAVFNAISDQARAAASQIVPATLSQLRGFNPGLINTGIFTSPGIIVVPPERLECFCLSVYVTGTSRIIGNPPNQTLVLDVERIEIVDITPQGLENGIECYLQLVLDKAILPQMLVGVSELIFSPVSLGTAGELLFSASTAAPHNPAIEENQLKLFVNLDSINIILPQPGGGGGNTQPWPDPILRYIPTRSRTDAFDLTVAVREGTLKEIFKIIGNQFKWSQFGSDSFGPFSVSYGIAVSVHNSELELRSDHQMTVSLDVNVDTLFVDFGIDIPEITIPGFCLIPPGFPKDWCAVWIPGTSFFSANPDITLPLDISGILSVALTLTAAPVFYYGEGTPNRWMLFIDPDPNLTNLTINGIGDIPGTLLENAINAAIASLGLPDWATDVIEAILGPLVDVIKGILGIVGDAAVWLINFIGDTLGLWNLLKDAVLEYIGSSVPLFQLPDPLPVIPAQTPEIEVSIPISFLGATVNDTELILQADIG